MRTALSAEGTRCPDPHRRNPLPGFTWLEAYAVPAIQSSAFASEAGVHTQTEPR